MLEKQFKAKITKILLAQGDNLKQAYLKHVKEKKDEDNGMSEADAEKLAYEITVAISYVVEGMQESMIQELTPLWIASGEAGNEFFNLVQFTKPEDNTLFAIIRQDYLDWLDNYAGEQITRINETTKELTKKIIKEGLVNGDSTNQIAENLVEQISQYTKGRAVKIGNTEIHNVFSTSQFMSAKASGFKYKTWLSVRDNRVRESHRLLDGKRIKLEDDFKDGLSHPGDSRAPSSEVVACRCTLTFD